MTFVPPLGASLPPVLSEATPAAADRPNSGGDMQALFENLNYSQLQGEFLNPEALGALSAQGTATLRDFLTRVKKFDSMVEARRRGDSNLEGADSGTPLHGGPAREPFESLESSPLAGSSTSDAIEEMKRQMYEIEEVQRLLAEETYLASLVSGISTSIGNLIKGQ